MPRKTKSNMMNEDSEMERLSFANRTASEQVEMPKLERSSFDDRRASERQTNAKRKIVINDERITKIERKNNPWVEHCKKYAQENKCSYKEAISKAKDSYVHRVG